MREPKIAIEGKDTIPVTCERYTMTMDGQRYTYLDYIDPTSGNCDTVVLNADTGAVVYDPEIVNELMMFITNQL